MPSFCTIRISIVDMVVLRVRTRRAGGAPQPEFLYQVFPPEAFLLLATLPRGKFKVSIPYHSNSGCGYVITKKKPAGEKGFVLIYALKPNRNYEAVKAIFRGREYGIGEFMAYASERIRLLAGDPDRKPDRYIYFPPTRDQWNVIQRDSGYMALDPAILRNDLYSEVLRKRGRITSSGVVVRIPLLSFESKGISLLPYFHKVELMLDSAPDIQDNWISFEEYVRIKAQEAVPPERIREIFPGWLNELKKDSGFKSWIFRAGRLFGARSEWWGDRNRRYAEHEGIDFAEGRDSKGLLRPMPEGTPVRAIEDGGIAVVLDDFLGKTILVRHSREVNGRGSVLYTQYSHIVPVDLPDSQVTKGQVLGRVGCLTDSRVPPHFHFAAAWIPQTFPPETLTLSHLHPAYVPVTLINFNRLIEAQGGTRR